MRSTAEILARIEFVKPVDFFGTITNDLLFVLPFEDAKPFLKDEVAPEQWKPHSQEQDAVKARMLDYLDFAFEKAEDHRGLSASRSIDHMRAWLWLLGDDEMLAYADNPDNFCNYGAPILKYIADKYGYGKPLSDRVERMARGEPCSPDCQDGCA